MSLSGHFDLTIFKRAAEWVARDPGVDGLVIIGGGLSPEDNQTFVQYMIGVRQEWGKPLVMVRIPGRDSDLSRQFCRAGIPFFDSAERAMRAYAQVFRYQRWRQKKTETDF